MRLFIAGNLPASVRDAIHADAVGLREAAPAVKWVSAPSLHITLKFLGERDESVSNDARRALESVGERHGPIDVRLTAQRARGIDGHELAVAQHGDPRREGLEIGDRVARDPFLFRNILP